MPKKRKKKGHLGFNVWRNLFLIIEVSSKIKFEKLKMKWLWKVLIARIKGENRKKKSQAFKIWLKMCCQKYKKMIKNICTSYLIYSHIELNLPKDDCHFGYKQKILKNTLVRKLLFY
jgi:hypothetical protein